MSVPSRTIGSTGLTVSAQGLGCMSMTDFAYGPADEGESIATIERALDLGVTLPPTTSVGPSRVSSTATSSTICSWWTS